MKFSVTISGAALIMAALLFGCGEKPDAGKNPRAETPVTATPNLLDLKAVGLRFEGPGQIGSGWTTIRLQNLSGMTHFALLYRLPEGVTAQRVSDEAIDLFQAMLSAQIAGDEDKVQALAGKIPSWVSDLVYLGGPGLLAPGETVATTMYLEPGRYLIECYARTNGVAHNYNPDPDQFGMIHPLTVTGSDGGANEPHANATLRISTNGYAFVDGALVNGDNTIRVVYADQAVYAGLVGHDAHFFRIDANTDIDTVARWMDFRRPEGLQTPAPAYFVGGIEDMPAGSTAYLKVHLTPGDYGIIAEIPHAIDKGLYATFAIAR